MKKRGSILAPEFVAFIFVALLFFAVLGWMLFFYNPSKTRRLSDF